MADTVSLPAIRAGDRPASGSLVFARTARAAARSGLVWGYVFALTVASSALGYSSAYKTLAQRQSLVAAFGSNAGLNAIVGPAHQLQTVPGYTAWKCLMFLNLLGAAWGILTATRLTRGEEDAGRWELLLAGGTTRRWAAAQAAAGIGVGLAVLWLLTAAATAGVGRFIQVGIAGRPALFFGLAAVCGAVMFAAVGLLAGQLASTRRQAATYSAAFLGLAFALRMVADSGLGLTWLRWASPLGWIEELQPLTGSRLLALVPILGWTAAFGGAAALLARNRDVGAGLIGTRQTPRPRYRLLSSPMGLAVRLGMGPAVSWAAGIGAMAFIVGLVAKQAGRALTDSSSVERALAKMSVGGSGAATYLGVGFLIVAIMAAAAAAGQISAIRAEEAQGRVDNLLVRPVSRARWLVGRLLVAGIAQVGFGLVAGLLGWLGCATEHAGLGFGTTLVSGLNSVIPAVCLLGAGAAFLGALPRLATALTYGLLAWSLLIGEVGGIIGSNHWVLDTSFFHQIPPAPAAPVEWQPAVALAVLATVLAVIGTQALGRRDLAED